MLELGETSRESRQPDRRVDKQMWQAWVHLALELMDLEDREVIVLRQWDELESSTIAERIGTSADAARMRFQRALPKLSQ